jgi:hypothetical protein
MLDFLTIKVDTKHQIIKPDFKTKNFSDIMIRGNKFYAIWDKDRSVWSTNEMDVSRLVDEELWNYYNSKNFVDAYDLKTMESYSSGSWSTYKSFVKDCPDSYVSLDSRVIFANTKVSKKDYSSKRLSYNLEEGNFDAYEKLVSTLYEPEERDKIEWAIGSVIAGDSKDIQKFLVFYGDPGSGKGTILGIIYKLFKPYATAFNAKDLGDSKKQFSTEPFKNNPLVAIDSDGNLSKIEDNTTLNSIISHEIIPLNAKYEKLYTGRVNAMLFIASNSPVKITDGKSGIMRRLIDVNPSGKTVPIKEFESLNSQIDFELGAIAYHCLQVYRDLGKDYYIGYRPLSMIYKTNAFYNFVENYYDDFLTKDGITLEDAWTLYKAYSEETAMEYKMPRYRFREELKNYFEKFELRARVDGKQVRKYYSGFKKNKFMYDEDYVDFGKVSMDSTWLEFNEQPSLFDEAFRDYPAQYDAGGDRSKPATYWDACKTVLSDIDTKRLHWVKTPTKVICIDFDIKDETGNKSFKLNLEAASKFPPTYAELSKSGGGIHLYYIYDGDVSKLSTMYSKDIEVKVYTGNSSIRRKLTKCNDIPVATIKSGLPLKGEKKVINFEAARSVDFLRKQIYRNLNKEVMDSTASSVSLIKKILDDAYEANQLSYDLRDMKQLVKIFAEKSTHQSERCSKMVDQMHFVSKDIEASERDCLDAYIGDIRLNNEAYKDLPYTFFDIEIFPNLCLIVYMDDEKEPVVLINPSPTEAAELTRKKLVGFNCRNYDNHIIRAIMNGYDNYNLYLKSQAIIRGDKYAQYSDAKNISYTDVFDFLSKKQSLKKWEIELKIPHKECPYRWDEDVPEDKWGEVIEYCINDVKATRAVFYANQADFIAREIISDISGLTVNDTTNSNSTRIIFGTERKPKLVYTNLATGESFDGDGRLIGIKSSNRFPGYEWKKLDDGKFHNMYRGVDVSKGGYVYAKPGMYYNVALLDVESLHPHSAKELNAFGEYTKNFVELMDARLYIKHKDYESAKKLFGGKLAKYLDDPTQAKALSKALKIVINSVYGLTSANFPNPFKDERNVNNIVALRGALFMKTLQDEVETRGFTVAHIKTDSIKIPNATPEIIEFCMDFAKKYGYTFDHEATYERMCLVNDAVYIAKYSKDDVNGEEKGKWTATGAQFQHPYVFKYLFSKEPILYDDMCETKSVQTALYLDMNEDLPDVSDLEAEYAKLWKKITKASDIHKEFPNETARIDELDELIPKGHNYIFIGKTGLFNPIKPGCGGGLLMREKDGKYSAATGTKGYRWLETEYVVENHKENDIDERYFRKLVDDAKDAISEYGDFYEFVDGDIPEQTNDVVFDITSDELPF